MRARIKGKGGSGCDPQDGADGLVVVRFQFRTRELVGDVDAVSGLGELAVGGDEAAAGAGDGRQGRGDADEGVMADHSRQASLDTAVSHQGDQLAGLGDGAVEGDLCSADLFGDGPTDFVTGHGFSREAQGA